MVGCTDCNPRAQRSEANNYEGCNMDSQTRRTKTLLIKYSTCFCWRVRVASCSLDLAMLFDKLIKQGRGGRAEIFTAREKSSTKSRVTAKVPDSFNTRIIAGCGYEKHFA